VEKIKMRKLFLCFAMLTFGLKADPLLTLSQTVVTASPGGDTGWGFTLTPDPLYFVSVSSAFVLSESNPALGFFTDFISLLGGPVNGSLAPGATPWTLSYDPINATGFGQFIADNTAIPGDSDSGQFLVAFLRFSADPATCGDCFVDTQTALVDFEVDVVPSAGVPEPGSGVMLLSGAALLAVWARNRTKTSARCSSSK
jgi:hypothetical protein